MRRVMVIDNNGPVILNLLNLLLDVNQFRTVCPIAMATHQCLFTTDEIGTKAVICYFRLL